MIKNKKAVALFSGGLDSILCVKYMQKLGYEVFPVFFKTPYLPEDKALQSAKANDLQLIVKDVTKEHLAMLKQPVYGFGKNANPCIDCHALMFQLAGDMLSELGADFLISGEVLGQRPMSQRRDALCAVAKICGYKDLLIRPLSQKLLIDTLPITEEWVDKNEMLDFSGRGRQRQKALAKELGISYYPQPGGGCLLTDPNYAVRMKDLLFHEEATVYNIELLKYGRHFRLRNDAKLIVGRDERDNNALEAVFEHGMKLFTEEIPGPLGILISPNYDEELIRLAASIYIYYNNKIPDLWTVLYGQNYPLDRSMQIKKADPNEIGRYILSLHKEK